MRAADRRRLLVVDRRRHMLLSLGVVEGLHAGDLVGRRDVASRGSVHLDHRVTDDSGRERRHGDRGDDHAPGPSRPGDDLRPDALGRFRRRVVRQKEDH